MDHGLLLDVFDGVGLLTIDRPSVRNSLNWAAQRQFAAFVDEAAQRDDVGALIITGRGSLFVAGGDIKDQTGSYDVATGQHLRSIMGAALRQLVEMPKPTIAAINGNAYGGGCEIVTACDLRVMAADAKLQFVHGRMGLTTGWGGGARLIHLIGASKALEFLLTASQIDAGTALDCGLVNQVVTAPETAAERAFGLAQTMLKLSPSALGALKQMVWRSADLERGYSAESELFLKQWEHPDHIEAVEAFLAKRKPMFR